MKQLLTPFCLLLALLPCPNLKGQSYTAIDLGDLLGAYGGSYYSDAYGLNNAGQVVGYTRGVDERDHATLFSGIGSGNIDLGALGGGESWAFAINDLGQVVGQAARPDQSYHAVLFSGTGTGNLDLGTLGGTISSARGINSSGQIVGTAASANNTSEYGTIFGVNGGSNRKLGSLSSANAINGAGQVVGEASNAGFSTAALFNITGNLQANLGSLIGGSSYASAISSTGTAVGTAQQGNGEHATLFSGTGSGNIDLGTLGGAHSNALGVNAAGQIVGRSSLTANGGPNDFSFLFSGGSMINLTLAISAQTSVLNFRASAINDWGQIVGDGNVLGSSRPYISHAVLLNPLSPLETISGGSRDAKVAAGMSFGTTSLQTGTGGFATAVRLLGGTATVNRDVTTVINSGGRLGLASDSVQVFGTGSDTFVLQLSYDEASAIAFFGTEADARLGWADPRDGQWKNAVEGNTGGIDLFAGEGAYDAATDFHLGTYGVDTAANTVWAVINHNSEFAAIAAVPEPSTWAFGALILAVASLSRSRLKISPRGLALLIAMGLCIDDTSVFAVSLPVAEDTSFSPVSLTLKAAAGKATALPISRKSTGLIFFDLGGLPDNVTALSTISARLRIFVPRSTVVGTAGAAALLIREVTSGWHEDANNVAAPTIDLVNPPLAAVDAGAVGTKRFIIADVSSIVRQWLATPATNHGIAILPATGFENVTLASKEGAGTGYPAELEIDVNPVAPLYFGGDPTNGVIEGSSIAFQTINSDQLKDGAVTNEVLADGSVTLQKLASRSLSATAGAGNVAGGALPGGSGGSSGNRVVTITSSSPQNTGLQVTLVTTGRPVLVCLVADPVNGPSYWAAYGGGATMFVFRDGQNIGSSSMRTDLLTGTGVVALDTPTAGGHVYKIQLSTQGTSTELAWVKLVAFEL